MLNLSIPKSPILQCGVGAVVSVALLSWLRLRPLGYFFIGVFCYWIYNTRCNLRIIPPPELQKTYDYLKERLCDWRKNNPTMFCAVSSGCLAALAILGHLLSGSAVVLLGLALAAIISTKYNFKFVKIDPKDFAWSEKINYDTELDDEFIPEVNESNLFVLERAGDLATISSPTDEAEIDDDKSDEVPSELLIPDSIPEIDEHSTDEEDEDLLPLAKRKIETTAAVTSQQPSSSKSYERLSPKKTEASTSATTDVMEFKKGHFKRDDSSLSTTSSSSEESLSKGLQFPDITTVDSSANAGTRLQSQEAHNQDASDIVALAVKSQTQALLANSGRFLPSLMSGLAQWTKGSATSTATGSGDGSGDGGADTKPHAAITAPVQAPRRVVTALDSSDESDFEILDNEDFK